MTSRDDGSLAPAPIVPALLAQLLASPHHERVLVEGSHLHGATFADWYALRSFITQFIHRPGSLLDIGCANGLLVLCLVAWSRHHVVPYGVDVDAAAIGAARRLLPEWRANLTQLGLGKLHHLPDVGLPPDYEFVYWNVWSDIDFTAPWHITYAEDAMGRVAPGGRLCLGFYEGDESEAEEKILRVVSLFGPVVDRAVSPAGAQVAAWWEKPPRP